MSEQPAQHPPEQERAELSIEEVFAWAEQFAETPFNALALSTSVAKQPGPMKVMRSALLHLRALASEHQQREDAVRAALTWLDDKNGRPSGQIISQARSILREFAVGDA